jgi:amino acid permease
LITGGGIINYNIMCLTYIFFYRAVKAQGVDRSKFAYTGWFQPYSVSHGSPHAYTIPPIKVRETDFFCRLTSAKDG